MTQRLGRYQIIRELAKGSFGDVFLATAPGAAGIPAQVAIKRLRPELVDRPDRLNSFISEARIGAALQHENIVRVIEFSHDQGQFFLVLEFVDGVVLEDVLLKLNQAGKAMPVGAALELAAQVCEGLNYAHSATAPDGRPLGLVHRDLKPGNIMLEAGQVKILDFSIARASTNLDRTATGVIKGSFGYMSPEQANGSVELGPASDLFTVGLLLLECATGEAVYNQRSDTERWTAARNGNVQQAILRLKDVLPAAVPLMERLLTKDAATRLSSAIETRDLLRALQKTVPSVPGLAEISTTFAKNPAEGVELGQSWPWLKVRAPAMRKVSTEEVMRKMAAQVDASDAGIPALRSLPGSVAKPFRNVDDASMPDTVRISRDAVKQMIQDAQAVQAGKLASSAEVTPTPAAATEVSPATPPGDDVISAGRDERQLRPLAWRTRSSAAGDPFIPMPNRKKDGVAPKAAAGMEVSAAGPTPPPVGQVVPPSPVTPQLTPVPSVGQPTSSTGRSGMIAGIGLILLVALGGALWWYLQG